MSLTAETLLLVSAATVAATQLLKWAGLDDRRGPWAVLGLSLAGVLLYQFSVAPDNRIFVRGDIWPVFSGWITVALAAAGVYGFTRAAPSAITSTSKPPDGAGQSRTEKPHPQAGGDFAT